MKEVKINENCVGCGLCCKDCPEGNVKIENNNAFVISQNCIKCGHCVAVCPKNAVSISGFLDVPVEMEKVVLNQDQLYNALKTRRSIRQFKNLPIEDNIIDKILDVGRITPTAKNAQETSFVVIKENIKKCEKLAVNLFNKIVPLIKPFYAPARNVKIDQNFFFKSAPVAIAVISKDKISASLAASNMALMAESFGLGVLYSGFFSIAANLSIKLKKELKIKHNKVVTTLVIGYPNVKYYRTVQREKLKVTYI